MLSRLNSGDGFYYNVDHKAKDIHEISVPTLVIHSPFDKNVPFSHALYTHKMIKGSRLFIAPAKSHLIYMGNDYECILTKRMAFLKENEW